MYLDISKHKLPAGVIGVQSCERHTDTLTCSHTLMLYRIGFIMSQNSYQGN